MPGEKTTTLPKLKTSFTNTSKEKVEVYNDGTKLRDGKVVTAGPRMSEIPGIGTLTVTPKNIPTGSAPKTDPAQENMDGLYARTGVTPAATTTPAGTPVPTGYTPPAVDGLPTYPAKYNRDSAVTNISAAYEKMLSEISTLESAIASSSVQGEEEKRLAGELATKKALLNDFDLGTLEAQESQRGQGRGRTVAGVALREGKASRVRALERLGLAQEVDTLVTQLGLSTEERKNQGDLAKTRYDLATKKLDIALGIQDKLKNYDDDERDNARQYLLDVVNFAEGKNYDDLDADTQAAITNAVANSPITMGMVKNALKKGAEADASELRSVEGLGVVAITTNPDGSFSYKVVVPEGGTNPVSDDPNKPTFEEYIVQQGYGLQSLVPSFVEELRSEYNSTYGTSVNLGKLTATNKADISQAGLSGAPSAVQSYFLNTPDGFRDLWQRKNAAGEIKQVSLSQMIDEYTKWYEEQNKDSGTRDWDALLAPTE